MFHICQPVTCQVLIWTSMVFKCVANTGDNLLAQLFQVEGEQPTELRCVREESDIVDRVRSVSLEKTVKPI